MPNLRVSATDIDALRYYLDDDEADLGELLAQMRRQLPPTPQMLAGTAFHKAFEGIDTGFASELEAMDHVFVLDLDAELDLPDVREFKTTREYLVDDVAVTLVGKVDAVQGRRIFDHKLTGSFDAERFMAGYQWRIYLELFGADEFRWNVFEGAEIADRARVWKVRSLHKLTMHRYPGMSADVEREVAAFVAFAREHLPEKFGKDRGMSGSINKVIVLGNLGQDPEVRTTQDGTKIVTLSVATSEKWKDRQTGEAKEKTEWHRVVIFGARDNDGAAGVAEKYLRKGSKVYIEGKLQTRKWQAQDGTDRYTTEVVIQGFGGHLVLLDRQEGTGRPPPPSSAADYGRTRSNGGESQSGGNDAPSGIGDDSIPF